MFLLLLGVCLAASSCNGAKTSLSAESQSPNRNFDMQSDLTEADALSDGFHSLTELRETLLDLLPNAREVSLCRIRFERA